MTKNPWKRTIQNCIAARGQLFDNIKSLHLPTFYLTQWCVISLKVMWRQKQQHFPRFLQIWGWMTESLEKEQYMHVVIKTSKKEVQGNVSVCDSMTKYENFSKKYKLRLWRRRDRKSNERMTLRIVRPSLAPLQS